MPDEGGADGQNAAVDAHNASATTTLPIFVTPSLLRSFSDPPIRPRPLFTTLTETPELGRYLLLVRSIEMVSADGQTQTETKETDRDTGAEKETLRQYPKPTLRRMAR